MNLRRWDIINTLIKKYKYNSYLEIGTSAGENFGQIQAKHKVCVDPVKNYRRLTYCMTSDEFFAQNTETFDVIFIDGLHIESQCTKDIQNALNVLNENGTIVVHDCLPNADPKQSAETRTTTIWYGSCYKSIIEFRYTSPELSVEVVATDCGCGIIRRGSQIIYDKVPLEKAKTLEYYLKHKRELMNVITSDEFIQNLR